MKILLTGGSGLLGQYLTLKADRPTSQELDVTKPIKPQDYDLIIHAAAYTDVQGSEEEKKKCFDINVLGVMNLIEAYPNTPIVYISTEYAVNPVNFYSVTKHMAEDLLLYRGNCLILRTLFKPTPWPFQKAFEDQITQGDYVVVIAPLIEEQIKSWSGKGKSLRYVGTGDKTIYELAKRTKPDVIPNSIKEMQVPIPANYK